MFFRRTEHNVRKNPHQVYTQDRMGIGIISSQAELETGERVLLLNAPLNVVLSHSKWKAGLRVKTFSTRIYTCIHIPRAHNSSRNTIKVPQSCGMSFISNTISPPPAICQWSKMGSSSFIPFTVNDRTYGFVAAPTAWITSGCCEPGRSIVTLSKKGLPMTYEVLEGLTG